MNIYIICALIIIGAFLLLGVAFLFTTKEKKDG